MSLIQLDLFNLIPNNLKTAIRDALVDFVSDQAKKVAGEELGRKLKQLRSDAAFNKQFEKDSNALFNGLLLNMSLRTKTW